MADLQAVVFDFDGLIMDTEEAEFQAWSSVFLDFGAELLMEEWCKCVGNAPGTWLPEAHLAELVSGVDTEEAVRLWKERRDAMICEMDVREGVVELWDELDSEGVAFGIASSARHVWVDGLLRQTGLRDRVSVIWTRDKTGRAKPWPDVYLRACEELGADPGRSVAVEDSPNGCLAGRAAGMKVLGVPNGVTAAFFEDDLCDLRVGGLGEVGVRELRGMVE